MHKLDRYLKVSNRTRQLEIKFVRERGKPDITHDVIGEQDEKKRPVLMRSMIILFAKKLVLQSERDDLLRGPIPGKPVHETTVIQTRSSEDTKDFNDEQTHKRTGRPVITHDVIKRSDSF